MLNRTNKKYFTLKEAQKYFEYFDNNVLTFQELIDILLDEKRIFIVPETEFTKRTEYEASMLSGCIESKIFFNEQLTNAFELEYLCKNLLDDKQCLSKLQFNQYLLRSFLKHFFIDDAYLETMKRARTNYESFWSKPKYASKMKFLNQLEYEATHYWSDIDRLSKLPDEHIDAELLKCFDIYKKIYQYDFNHHEFNMLFDVLKNSIEAQENLKQMFENQIDFTFQDFNEIISRLKKKSKRTMLSI